MRSKAQARQLASEKATGRGQGIRRPAVFHRGLAYLCSHNVRARLQGIFQEAQEDSRAGLLALEPRVGDGMLLWRALAIADEVPRCMSSERARFGL